MPDSENPLVWVHDDAVEDFMKATALEAYPDDGDNGSQSLHRYGENEYCDILADTPEDLNPDRGDPARTLNDDTWDQEAGEYKPLVALSDVKPGDFGELTLSYHLCDNPGYVWFNGELVEAAENGHTEPERKDPDEVGGPNTTNDTGRHVELVDAIQTLAWYDEDLDNVYEPGGESAGEVDVVLVLDRSGSMGGDNNDQMRTAAKNLVDALNLGPNAAQVGVVSFADQERLDQGLTTDATTAKNAIDGVGSSGSTNLEGGVNGGEEELRGSESNTDFSSQISPSGNDRPSADKVMVVLSDGSPNVNDDSSGDYSQDDDGTSFGNSDPTNEASRAKTNGVEIYSIGLDTTTATGDLLEDMATDSDHFFTGGAGQLTQIFGQISQQIAGEECFFRGTLGELLDELERGHGIPLDGDRSTQFDEINGDPGDADRDCVSPSTNNAIGLAWWLPVDHANEIQTDSVTFDLGFYTEQCRHNDGSGLLPTQSFTSDEVYVHRTSDLGFGNEQALISDINGASDEDAPKLQPIQVDVTYGDPVVYEIQPTLGMEDPSNMAIGFDPEADGGAWDFQVLWESGGAGFTYLENGGTQDDPTNVSGISADYDSNSNLFTIEVAWSRLDAGGNDYRFAMQSIHEPGAPNNPLNPSGSNARVDAELPSGFDWGDTSTWQDDTLQS
jgi:Mg-chelatase subunit ChlD